MPSRRKDSTLIETQPFSIQMFYFLGCICSGRHFTSDYIASAFSHNVVVSCIRELEREYHLKELYHPEPRMSIVIRLVLNINHPSRSRRDLPLLR